MNIPERQGENCSDIVNDIIENDRTKDHLGSITSRCSGKEPALLPELTAGLMDLALLILTNEVSACLNRAGCINYLSRSSSRIFIVMLHFYGTR